jgi:hypothetical protein
MQYTGWQESSEQQLKPKLLQQVRAAAGRCNGMQRRQIVRIHAQPWQHPALVRCAVRRHITAGTHATHITSLHICMRCRLIDGHAIISTNTMCKPQLNNEAHKIYLVDRVGAPAGRQHSRHAASVASRGRRPAFRWTGTMWTACSPTAAGGVAALPKLVVLPLYSCILHLAGRALYQACRSRG